MSMPLLFPKQARAQFIDRTRQSYYDMEKRAKKLGSWVPFPLVSFRTHILMHYMGDDYGGALQCPHCFVLMDITEVAFDHATPICRGGSLGLENIVPVCQPCNFQKGEMNAKEFNDFLSLLERELPYARTYILKRLEQYSKLLAGKRQAEAKAGQANRLLAGSPIRQPKVKPPLVAAIDERF